jgi:formylglycine-generating enzyme required for sulfatase activity
MKTRSTILMAVFVSIFAGGSSAFADCPLADLTGDCFVDFEDFAVIGAQWLNEYDWNDLNTLANQWLTTGPCVPDDMVCIAHGAFEMGDHFAEGDSDELPLHPVLVDAFFMSKYEVTNQQYCDYLNSAFGTGIYVSGGIVYGTGNNQPYGDTASYDTDSQIDYNDVSGTFRVRTKGEPPRDMSDDPMVEVSWYGAAAYCNWRSSEEGYEACYNLSTWECDFSKRGYRLPTEAEWEYSARGGLPGKRFPWADPNITHSQANYYSSSSFSYDISPTRAYHPDWDDAYPYTSVVGTFSANGYGLYDMAGNVWEWCNDWYASNYYDTSPYDNPTGPASGPSRVLRGGGWAYRAFSCRVANRTYGSPDFRARFIGFRFVLDLE